MQVFSSSGLCASSHVFCYELCYGVCCLSVVLEWSVIASDMLLQFSVNFQPQTQLPCLLFKHLDVTAAFSSFG